MSNPKLLPGHVWLLEQGNFHNDRGIVVCVAKSRENLLLWIEDTYPSHKRDRRRSDKGELFFEDEVDRTWLRCRAFDQCLSLD